MFKTIITYGLLAGLIVCVPLFSIILFVGCDANSVWSMAIGYLTMLIALSTVFVAIKHIRDTMRGGVIGFWPALGIGLAVSAVAGVFYVLAWDLTCKIGHIDFADSYAKAMIDGQKAKGVSGPALAKLTADMDAFKIQYANPLWRWPMSFMEIFPVGVLVSLISAGLLRNPRLFPARPTA